MPKVKVKRKGVSLDMTAMCDVAFLLLTFFILTTKFKPNEAVVIDTPTSVSITKLPETDLMLISVAKDGRVFFGIDGQFTRVDLLNRIAKHKGLTFNDNQKAVFSLMDGFGVPLNQLGQFLSMEPSDRNRVEQPGIPIDSLTNELGDWVINARYANPKVRIAIKGDRGTDYKVIKKVIDILQQQNINRFNLVTGLEANPNLASIAE
jgi:biopolymer transport protein ExbD